MSEKDLFYLLIESNGSSCYSTYFKEFLPQLPKLLLNAAEKSAPEIRKCIGYVELSEALASPMNVESTWRNPELYPYLNYLAFQNNSKRQNCVDSLRVHCSLSILKKDTNPDIRYWRLRKDHPIVTTVDEGRYVNHEDLVWIEPSISEALIVSRPFPCLYDDIEPRLYGEQETKYSNREITELLQDAFAIIGNYSESLADRIAKQVFAINFLKRSQSRPISYTLRNRFCGAIFVSISTPVELAEQIIHEYYHLCIWSWWLLDPPEDLPSVDLKVKSPVTGNIRSLPTMIQAVVIYSSLIDFYAFVARNPGLHESTAAAKRSTSRECRLNESIEVLAQGILNELQGRPATRQMVSQIIKLSETI